LKKIKYTKEDLRQVNEWIEKYEKARDVEIDMWQNQIDNFKIRKKELDETLQRFETNIK